MRIFLKIVFFIPGAAIGFILSAAISQASQEAGMAIAALGAAVGGSITTALGTMLFLKAETEAQKSGGFVKFIIPYDGLRCSRTLLPKCLLCLKQWPVDVA